MSPRTLTGPAYGEAIRSFEREAFRLELQPAYPGDDIDGRVTRWLAGDRTPPLDDATCGWFDWVRSLTAEGRRLVRVRVFEDNPTDYQRWLFWASRWNVEAGEVQQYMTRSRARAAGLLPEAGPDDWWLLDGQRLVVMRFTPDGEFTSELVGDPERVAQACKWRDLATRHSTPDTRGQAA